MTSCTSTWLSSPRIPRSTLAPLPPRVAPRTPPRPPARRAIQLVGEEVFPVAREVLGAADAPRVTLGVRPEDLEVVESGGLLIEADVVEELGADAYVYGRTRFATASSSSSPGGGRNSPTKGDTLHVRPRRGHVHLFRISDGGDSPADRSLAQGRAVRRRTFVCS